MNTRICISNISALITMEQASEREGPLGILEHAAVLIEDGRVVWIGHERDLPAELPPSTLFDACGMIVMPGLVDCHTHLVHAGFRQEEFHLRSQGKSYQEIAEAGGGIMSTVHKTREASLETLVSDARARADEALAMGTTALEIKTGYGLSRDAEQKMVWAIEELESQHPIRFSGTFLGAHVVPPEFRERRGDYIRGLLEEMLPAVARSPVMNACDIFVEEGAFDREEARNIANAARGLGLRLHLHIDQFRDGGGGELAAELGALSADHLDYTSDTGLRAMAEKGVVGVALPGASFFAGRGHFPNARNLIDQGVCVALATDYNPGTNPSLDLWLAATIAVTQMGMTCEEALLGITKHAALALGRDDVGRLRVGACADMIMLDVPDIFFPLYRYGIHAVKATIIGGRVVCGTVPTALKGAR